MSTRAIIVVDLQREYLPTGKLPLQRLAPAVDNAARVIEAARKNGVPVIHIRHEQPSAPIFLPGSEGVAFIPEVIPGSAETIITKNYPNAFRKTGLERLLKDLGVDQVVLLGAMSHMCIAATARAASDLGFETIVVHDGCATMDLEHEGIIVPAEQVHAANMAALAFGYGTVESTDTLLAR